MPDGADAPTDLKIRQAVQQDASMIFRLLTTMHAENLKGFPDIEPSKAMMKIVHVIAMQGAFVLGGVENGQNRIVGTIGLEIQSDWFSNDKYICDVWTYIKPSHRSKGAFNLLVDKASEVAENLEAPLRLGIVGMNKIDVKTKLYARMGLKPAGVSFIKE